MTYVQKELSMARDIKRICHKRCIPLIICIFIPSLLLVGAYIRMAIFHGRLWLFDTIVHENGRYTLLEVIFYFRHFCWEMPMKALYSMFIVGAFLYYGKPVSGTKETHTVIPSRLILLSGLAVFLLVSISIIMTIKDTGFRETMLGLLQYRTSELKPPDFGSHWRNHLLSNVVLFSASALFILYYRLNCYSGQWMKRQFSSFMPLSLGLFVLLTFVFGLTTDPFKTPSYIGHQLREIFGTDIPITMLITIGVMICLERKYDKGCIKNNESMENSPASYIQHIIVWSIFTFIPTFFLIAKVLTFDFSDEIERLGGTEGWSTMDIFAWHFYEHFLDYLFVISLVVFLYLIVLVKGPRKRTDQLETG
jgi:hypothetical protein